MFSLDAGDVQKIIDKAIGSNYAVTNYSLESFSTKKPGIFGSYCLLKVSVKNVHKYLGDCENKALTFFIKSLPESDVIQGLLEDTFEEEINFYKNIKPLMVLDYKSERWSPRCYLAKNNVLVLEDLCAQGFSIKPDGTIMDERLLKSALSALARFHASTLFAESKLGKPLNEAFPKFLSEKTFDPSMKVGQSTLLAFETIVLMAEKFELDASFVLPHMYEYLQESVKSRKGELNVLCHNDLWNKNMLFNENDVPECIIVDYQLLRYATPVADLSMLLYLNATPEFRREFEDEMVRHYYCIFQETIDRSSVKIKIPTFESMLETYRKYRLIGMAMAAIAAPLNYIPPERIQNVLDDPKGLERYMLYNRMETIEPLLDTTDTYATKIKDSLCEVLNEGRRVLNL